MTLFFLLFKTVLVLVRFCSRKNVNYLRLLIISKETKYRGIYINHQNDIQKGQGMIIHALEFLPREKLERQEKNREKAFVLKTYKLVSFFVHLRN